MRSGRREGRTAACRAVLYAAAALACAEPRPAPVAVTLPAAPSSADAGSAELVRPAAAAQLETALNRSWLERLGVPAAWQQATGKNIVVAVVDNGFYADDPLLAGSRRDAG